MKFSTAVLIGLATMPLSCREKDEPDFDGWPESSAPEATMPIGLTSITTDPNVIGFWKKDCQVSEGKSFFLSIEVTENYLIYNTIWFKDLFCKTETLAFRHIAQYRAENGQLNAQLVESHIRIEDEPIRIAAEKSKSCGFGRWDRGTWHNVTGQTCTKSNSGGVWTGWTIPGTLIMNQEYEITDTKLTIRYTNSSSEFNKQ